MKMHLDTQHGTFTITLNCDLTSTTVEQLRPELHAQLATPANPGAAWKLFRLDLAATKMVDSVGLNLIIGLLKAIQQRGARMQILCANPNVHRTFLFTRLDQHLELIKL
jgi:anti-anti-sigma factor